MPKRRCDTQTRGSGGRKLKTVLCAFVFFCDDGEKHISCGNVAVRLAGWDVKSAFPPRAVPCLSSKLPWGSHDLHGCRIDDGPRRLLLIIVPRLLRTTVIGLCIRIHR
mgnify:CR=1 FL=1